MEPLPSLACERCTALCCRYVAVEIDAPDEERDFENIRWYVSHENVQVYQDDRGDWYIQFLTPCRNLGPGNRCLIHPGHYLICKEYEDRKCEFSLGQGGERHVFRCAADVDRYVRGLTRPRPTRARVKAATRGAPAARRRSGPPSARPRRS